MTLYIPIITLLFPPFHPIPTNSGALSVDKRPYPSITRTALITQYLNLTHLTTTIMTLSVTIVTLLCGSFGAIAADGCAVAIEPGEVVAIAEAGLVAGLGFAKRGAAVAINRVVVVALLCTGLNAVPAYCCAEAINSRKSPS